MLIALLILQWMPKVVSVRMRTWCMLHGVENKETKQREQCSPEY